MSNAHAHRYAVIDDDAEVADLVDLCGPCARSQSDRIDGPVEAPSVQPNDDYTCDGCGRRIYI
jgi:hypothetical protein